MNETNKMAYEVVADELCDKTLALYGRKHFVRDGKLFADMLYAACIEGGSLIKAMASMVDRGKKVETANAAIVQLSRAEYIITLMVKGNYYTANESYPLASYISKVCERLTELLNVAKQSEQQEREMEKQMQRRVREAEQRAAEERAMAARIPPLATAVIAEQPAAPVIRPADSATAEMPELNVGPVRIQAYVRPATTQKIGDATPVAPQTVSAELAGRLPAEALPADGAHYAQPVRIVSGVKPLAETEQPVAEDESLEEVIAPVVATPVAEQVAPAEQAAEPAPEEAVPAEQEATEETPAGQTAEASPAEGAAETVADETAAEQVAPEESTAEQAPAEVAAEEQTEGEVPAEESEDLTPTKVTSADVMPAEEEEVVQSADGEQSEEKAPEGQSEEQSDEKQPEEEKTQGQGAAADGLDELV